MDGYLQMTLLCRRAAEMTRSKQSLPTTGRDDDDDDDYRLTNPKYESGSNKDITEWNYPTVSSFLLWTTTLRKTI